MIWIGSLENKSSASIVLLKINNVFLSQVRFLFTSILSGVAFIIYIYERSILKFLEIMIRCCSC